MGSKFVCEKAAREEIAKSAAAVWNDDGDFYYLREASDEESFAPNNKAIECMIHKGGTSSAVWAIGSKVICKVKTWCEGMEMESSTLAFVCINFPHIPVPEVVFSWLDAGMNRTFLLIKRVEGQTLQCAWPSLSSQHRLQIASTVAQYCRDLATLQAHSLQTATGLGVLEPFLNVDAENPIHHGNHDY